MRDKTETGIPEELTEEQREQLRLLMEKLVKLGICAIYGEEHENVPDADVPCESYLPLCKAACCTFHFALTKKEVREGRHRHNPAMPFFIMRDDDGYCHAIERDTLRCRIWEERPLRCRRYDCRNDPQAWPEKPQKKS